MKGTKQTNFIFQDRMRYNKAFTLIEVLVIMMVFCVGILTVLYSITQTITNKEIVKLQLQTSFIGREGIELMYNLRDSNFKKELPWDCLFRNMDREDSEPCKWYFASWMNRSWTALKIAIGTGDQFIFWETGSALQDSFTGRFEQYQLFKLSPENSTLFQYVYTGEYWWTVEPSNYARYLIIKPLIESGNFLDTWKVVKIESHVLFDNGLLTGEDMMETILWNYQF